MTALSNLPPDQAAFSRIMQGLGAIDTRVEPIEYKPRQGLVVPPAQAKADLPTPVASVDPAQSGNWVRDPDQLERERRQAIEAARKDVDGRPLTTDEILAVNRAATGLDKIPGQRRARRWQGACRHQSHAEFAGEHPGRAR